MKKFKEFGFSLIEIMIALSLLAGVSLFIVKISKRGIDVKKTVGSDFQINQFYTHIGKLLMSKETCEINLGGPGTSVTPASPYLPKPFGIAHPLTSFKVPTNPPTAAGNDIYLADGTTRYGDNNFVITKMEVLQDSPGDFGLHISIRKTVKEAQGGKDLRRRIPLAVKLNAANDRIVSCFMTQDEQSEIVCDSIEGYQWNGATKRCEKLPLTNPITTYTRSWTNTGTSTVYNQDFCALSKIRFGDQWKSSSTQECRLTKIGARTWQVRRWKEEARDLHCSIMCFSFN